MRVTTSCRRGAAIDRVPAIGRVFGAILVMAGVGWSSAVGEELATAPVLPDAADMAPVLVDELPRFDTTGWPPSPSAVRGERLWDPPRLTHWPGIVYHGERRHVALSFPVRQPGAVRLGFVGDEPVSVEPPTPLIGKEHSALLWLPGGIDGHRVVIDLPDESPRTLPIRVVGMEQQDWPHHHLVDGMPVDWQGVPVVLSMPRWEPERERRWAIFTPQPSRPTGEAVLLGDPLAALGEDAWEGVEGQRLEAVDDRFPHHAVLIPLARLTPPWPKALVWSPGNAGLEEQTWQGEEERVLSLIRGRCAHLGIAPRLILLLPPVPVDESLRAVAEERRADLRRMARFLGWEVLDAARVVGRPEVANRVADGIFTRYPTGSAQEALRQALIDTLARE